MGERVFGYACVSSKEQNLDRQILELGKYVAAENILVDKASGKDLGRPSLPRPDVFPDLYREWKAGNITARAAMDRMGMKKTRFYRSVREYEEKFDKSGQICSAGLEGKRDA